MARININKPTGEVESLNLISAFQVEQQKYVILDSERLGSMGLPIIYVCKLTNKLEKINDENEWQSVKNYLKGIISGTNFQYIKIDPNQMADEVYYKALTLPQASFDLIKSRYVINESSSDKDLVNEYIAQVPNVEPINPTVGTPAPPVVNEPKIMENIASPVEPQVVLTPAAPVAPTPVVEPTPEVPRVEPVIPPQPTTTVPPVEPTPVVTNMNAIEKNNSFDIEKETFIKACENMFDALMGKYEKKLMELEAREKELARKEQEVNMRLQTASEHLANAEAREQVANIAHDNAQRVMDISNLMPNNPNAN